MNDSKNNALIFQDYLVIYFDLLGQREALRKIKRMPTSEFEKDKFIKLARESLGRVLEIRRDFKEYFNATRSHMPNTDLVPQEFRNEFIKSQKQKLHYYGLSDATVIAVPIMNENENCTSLNSVFSALSATCAITLLLLSCKTPARAGIDIGVGCEIEHREIYGPALERAVQIESQIAEYPRLVVGKELLVYLSWVEKQNYKTRLGSITVNRVKECRKLLTQDTDGQIILNYLGNNVKEVFGNEIESEIVLNAWNYVREQHQKYINEGNEKLSSRYFRLRQYFESHLESWGIK